MKRFINTKTRVARHPKNRHTIIQSINHQIVSEMKEFRGPVFRIGGSVSFPTGIYTPKTSTYNSTDSCQTFDRQLLYFQPTVAGQIFNSCRPKSNCGYSAVFILYRMIVHWPGRIKTILFSPIKCG